MITIKVIVLCSNSEGAPEFHSCTVEVTDMEYAQGVHYEKARENAEHNGYEPKYAFDENDPAAKQLGDLHAWI